MPSSSTTWPWPTLWSSPNPIHSTYLKPGLPTSARYDSTHSLTVGFTLFKREVPPAGNLPGCSHSRHGGPNRSGCRADRTLSRPQRPGNHAAAQPRRDSGPPEGALESRRVSRAHASAFGLPPHAAEPPRGARRIFSDRPAAARAATLSYCRSMPTSWPARRPPEGAGEGRGTELFHMALYGTVKA